jgi:hypothetical protein
MGIVKHDFFSYMASIKKSITDEYNLMHKRVLEDPGIAGDQAEELWATLLATTTA